MIDESTITFQGPGPFHLPIAQRATAHGNTDNGVTIALSAILPERELGLESVSVQMLSTTARELAAALLKAADVAESQ